MRVALVGAGNIADRYAAAIAARRRARARRRDGRRPRSRGRARRGVRRPSPTPRLDALLADDARRHGRQPHRPAGPRGGDRRRARRPDKHVHSEKPLALRHADAQQLVELARARGVRLSCAPATLLGEAQQTVWKLVRDGAIGRVRAAYAEANWDRVERWHPDPRSLYAVGPLVDVGVYPLTILTAMFGPVRRVHAYATTLEPERVLLDGTPFTPGAPDFVVAVLEHAGGGRHAADRELLRRPMQPARARAPRRHRLARTCRPGRRRTRGSSCSSAAASTSSVQLRARAVRRDRLGRARSSTSPTRSTRAGRTGRAPSTRRTWSRC